MAGSRLSERVTRLEAGFFGGRAAKDFGDENAAICGVPVFSANWEMISRIPTPRQARCTLSCLINFSGTHLATLLGIANPKSW